MANRYKYWRNRIGKRIREVWIGNWEGETDIWLMDANGSGWMGTESFVSIGAEAEQLDRPSELEPSAPSLADAGGFVLQNQ